jgi:hypothetical protein
MMVNSYVLVSGVLFIKNYNVVLLTCLPIQKTREILKEMHEGVCGAHFSPKVTVHHIIRVGYYWPTIFKDSYSLIRTCSTCQKNSKRMKRVAMPLQPILVDALFMQWELD